jgi:hypothetical protein
MHLSLLIITQLHACYVGGGTFSWFLTFFLRYSTIVAMKRPGVVLRLLYLV